MKTQLTSTDPNVLAELGLDYRVIGEPLYLKGATDSAFDYPIPERIAYVRHNDGQTTIDPFRVVLGIASPVYTPFQNKDLLDLVNAIGGETGLPFLGGGVFDQGRKVYLQLKSQDLDITYPNGKRDRIIGMITAVNSHDCSTPLSFGFSHKTVSCENMFHGGLLSSKFQGKMRHTSNLEINVKIAMAQVKQLREQEEKTFEVIQALSKPQAIITQNDVDMVFKRMMRLPENSVLWSSTSNVVYLNPDVDTISTRKENTTQELVSYVNSEIESKGATPWGLFSGVTRFTTHSKYETSERAEYAKLFGGVGTQERNIFQSLSA